MTTEKVSCFLSVPKLMTQQVTLLTNSPTSLQSLPALCHHLNCVLIHNIVVLINILFCFCRQIMGRGRNNLNNYILSSNIFLHCHVCCVYIYTTLQDKVGGDSFPPQLHSPRCLTELAYVIVLEKLSFPPCTLKHQASILKFIHSGGCIRKVPFRGKEHAVLD